ncbi:putative leucine--tRNA ligase, partial [Opisthorchis viverrini]
HSNLHNSFKVFEEKWTPVIRDHDKKNAALLESSAVKKHRSYVLSMFPYPSGTLHLGHLRVYTVADALSRYRAMRGNIVLQPMGWDAFGLPAENAAIDKEVSPEIWTERNIAHMREQMESTMLLGLDWSREINTSSADYYRWTQWLFLKLYEAGLAYQRFAFVNWDPVDQTVLADELIDAEGRSWRSGAVVERRPLRQWYFRTTVYSKSLLDGLKEIEGNEWRDVVQMQRGWLGTLDGTQIELDVNPVVSSEEQHTKEESCAFGVTGERVNVFTKYPGLAVADVISHIGVHPGSVYFEEQFRMPETQRGLNTSRKLILCSHHLTGNDGSFKLSLSSTTAASPWPERLAVAVRHPFTGRQIPMIRLPNSTQCETMAFPNQLSFNLKPHGKSLCLTDLLDLPPSDTKLTLLNSEDNLQPVDPASVPLDEVDRYAFVTSVTELNGVAVSHSAEKAMDALRRSGRGGYWSSELRTDWLVSRQRYWGTPIPIVHCRNCGPVPVPEDQLPVRLPPLHRPLKRGDAPLKDNVEWRNTVCPKCGEPGDRETDTLDTFVDSSWYYLRYLDPQNHREVCERRKAHGGLPVDIYVGGIEHAIRHLYYARFMAHFLYDLGITPCREPFSRFLPIGLILGQTFVEPNTGRYVAPTEPEHSSHCKQGRTAWLEKRTGSPLKITWDKMSKSKLNGVDPAEVVERHGTELVRLTMLANVGPHRERKWQEDGVLRGIVNWQSKIGRLVDGLVELSKTSSSWVIRFGLEDPLYSHPINFRSAHEHIVSQVNHCYNDTFVLSAVIARLQELTDLLRKTAQSSGGPGPTSFMYLRALADLIVMLAPIAPIFACEMWSRLQIACNENTSSNVLDLLRSVESSDHNGFHPLGTWPYDLSKFALDQPFPVHSGCAELDIGSQNSRKVDEFRSTSN